MFVLSVNLKLKNFSIWMNKMLHHLSNLLPHCYLDLGEGIHVWINWWEISFLSQIICLIWKILEAKNVTQVVISRGPIIFLLKVIVSYLIHYICYHWCIRILWLLCSSSNSSIYEALFPFFYCLWRHLVYTYFCISFFHFKLVRVCMWGKFHSRSMYSLC